MHEPILLGIEFKGFFQRDMKMAEKAMKEANPDGTDFAEWKAAEERSNKKYEWEAKIVHYDARKGIWIAAANDEYGESCLAGKFVAVSVNEVPRTTIVFFEKLYVKKPENFPRQFFVGVMLAPYDLSDSQGQFRQVSYFGEAQWRDNSIKMTGKYQPLGLSSFYRGIWTLESIIPKE